MTESEWLECEDPTPMLWFLKGKASDRKMRLFACACCRRIWHLVTHEPSRQAVELSEKFADEHATSKELEAVAYAASAASYDTPGGSYAAEFASAPPTKISALSRVATDYAYAASVAAVDDSIRAETWRATAVRNVEKRYQTLLLRAIFGNPFRPVSINPIWLTPTVLSLAQAAYEERSLPSGELDPERLAVLSDAVEELGCDDEDILEHLRSPGPHVRGCWAVDLILGKS